MYEVPPNVPVSPDIVEALIHPDDRPLLAAATADGLAGRGIDVEFRILFPDGRIRWIHSKGTTIFDADGRPSRTTGVKVDVTARKKAELQIHEQQRHLAHLSRVAVAGELSLALAHELNQPLAAILANASAARRFLLRDPPDLHELREIVESIAHDNRRAAAVITQFIALLKRADARWTVIDVNDVVASVVDISRGDIVARGVSLTKRFTEGLPRVRGDAVQLQQVVLNLIVNACDAMEAAAPEARRLSVATGHDGQGGSRVTVSDTGPGIPGDRLDEIFEPFVTTKPQRLGLGLAICRSIVNAHDGQLDVDSQPGRGAAFSVCLPAALAAHTSEPTPATAAEVSRETGLHPRDGS
jgi:C4-dicarboxylate-specific signal transduction histidine kinase